MRLIMFLSFMLLSFFIKGQDVTYTLTNPREISENGSDYYLMDVLTYSNQGFKLGAGQLYFNYDTTAFGPNIIYNNGLQIIIPDSSLLDKTVDSLSQNDFYGDLVANDNTISRFSISWQHLYSYVCLDTVNVEYHSDILFTVKIKLKDGQSGNDPQLCLESNSVYKNQTYTPCGPDTCDLKDCFNHIGTRILNDQYLCNDCRIVYSTADNGPGTLRNALDCASSGDTIRFSKSLKLDSIVINSDGYLINKNINILANKDLKIYIYGDQIGRIFDILFGKTVVLEGLRMNQGTATEGSAIHNKGFLTLRDISIYITDEVSGGSHVFNLGDIYIEGNTKLIKNP